MTGEDVHDTNLAHFLRHFIRKFCSKIESILLMSHDSKYKVADVPSQAKMPTMGSCCPVHWESMHVVHCIYTQGKNVPVSI